MTDSLVWLNGRLLPQSQARLSPLSQGWLSGFGIYETLAVRNGQACDPDAHLNRLAEGLARLGLTGPDAPLLEEAILALCSASSLGDARVRITITAGAPGTSDCDCLITAVPLLPEKPVASVVTVPWRRNERSPLAGIKFTACPDNVLARRFAASAGADEGIFLNTRDELCEGAFSNIFLVRDGMLLTPPLSSGCLPGITRARVLRSAGDLGLPCQEVPIPAGVWSGLTGVTEIFLTSSIRVIQPVIRADGRDLAAPGPVSRQLMASAPAGFVR